MAAMPVSIHGSNSLKVYGSLIGPAKGLNACVVSTSGTYTCKKSMPVDVV